MFDLVLAVACSVAIGVIFKHTGSMDVDRTALLTVNYAAAVAVAGVIISFGARDLGPGLELSKALVGLGVGTGALLIAGFFLLSFATDVAGMSLAVGVMRLSAVLPFLGSWLLWSEAPSISQVVGMVLAGVAFFLIAHKRRAPDAVPVSTSSLRPGGSVREALSRMDWFAFSLLALTFCTGGAVDLSMKAFEETFRPQNSRVLFLLMAFGVAFLIGALLVGVRAVRWGYRPRGPTIGWGIVLGVVNYGSLEFILRAIAALPGPFVFPANNIAIMLLSAVIGVSLWDEALSLPNRIGMGLAVGALILLRL